ncbi:HTH-type transcriptional regulatory protein GabR [Dyadobacter sp. CECT 9275]|uniref:HTH-type transcriptional regulatory protein GabR n=1 Tax=Dyadobacter helix TaxID=2822344 RepID=A0A916NCZ1_9BACT|nr:PLP-dependent aminotransferase family protein [Dyadobacter sp. CECT 9275]CAG5007584.1 HTH-type transcriptional regulatory protein GabR [Dyadobacter sp. CECT 9275]
MSSPVEIPFESLITIDRENKTPVYQQIARQIIISIQQGILRAGVKLPGSRTLAARLTVHRKTVVAAVNELDAQGWIEVIPDKGIFVSSRTTETYTTTLPLHSGTLPTYPGHTGFAFKQSMLLDRPVSLSPADLEFTDGLPDVRLAPLDKLSKAYASVLRRNNSRKHLGYSHVEGNEYFRDKLAIYLNDTRGLQPGTSNILTTRGIQMGIFLVSMLLLEPGDTVLVGDLSYYVANMIFQQAGAHIRSIPVDEHGISLEAVRKLCVTSKVRMLYITPHHHYPTTVTLSAERRIELLNLSAQYGFIILEDDYDYDFHYQSSPVLPLASADRSGMVVYIGSFCKALAPGLRCGYIVAPQNLIAELAKLRRIIDRQGDMVMEQALGEMLHEGEIRRHLKKAQKIYQARRDELCQLLHDNFQEHITFHTPPGGLAVWTEWTRNVNLLRISRECLRYNLHLPQTLLFQTGKLSAVRLGFGNMNEAEMNKAISILAEVTRRTGKD